MVRQLRWTKLIAATAAACVALSTYAIAGPRSGAERDYARQSGGNPGSRFDPTNNSAGPNSQSNDSSSNSDFSRDRSRDDASDFGRNRSDDVATDTSGSEQSAPAQAGSNSSDQRNSRSSFIHRAGEEQAVETHEGKSKEGERESSEHRSEKSEASKKFESSLLLADVAGAPRGPAASGPTNNPGLDHMSQQGLQNSEAGRTTAQNAIDSHGSANPSTPPGHHYGWKRGEDNPHNPRPQRERLNEQEIERVREFLQHHLTEQQREGLKRILADGLTPTEREELRDFFKERMTPKQWEALKVFLNHKINESD